MEKLSLSTGKKSLEKEKNGLKNNLQKASTFNSFLINILYFIFLTLGFI